MTLLEPYTMDGTIGIQYMIVQREDTTGMGTILLEEVYQVRRVKA
jgi:hypothetical protein